MTVAQRRKAVELTRNQGDQKVEIVDITIPFVVYLVEGIKAVTALAIAGGVLFTLVTVIGIRAEPVLSGARADPTSPLRFESSP